MTGLVRECCGQCPSPPPILCNGFNLFFWNFCFQSALRSMGKQTCTNLAYENKRLYLGTEVPHARGTAVRHLSSYCATGAHSSKSFHGFLTVCGTSVPPREPKSAAQFHAYAKSGTSVPRGETKSAPQFQAHAKSRTSVPRGHANSAPQFQASAKSGNSVLFQERKSAAQFQTYAKSDSSVPPCDTESASQKVKKVKCY